MMLFAICGEMKLKYVAAQCTLGLHVPFIIFPWHTVTFAAAVFLFPLAAGSVSHAIFKHSFLSLASLASQPKLFYAYEAEQR